MSEVFILPGPFFAAIPSLHWATFNLGGNLTHESSYILAMAAYNLTRMRSLGQVRLEVA